VTGPAPPDPPVYRAFARLAFAAALLGGAPLGVWMLTRLYWGGGPVVPSWVLLHAHLLVFGLFAGLILGIAPELVARFAGRPVEPPAGSWLLTALALALGLRVVGTLAAAPAWILAAALVQLLAFGRFAVWVWRALDPPALRPTRAHLALATAWLVGALAVEVGLRAAAGDAEPDPGGMRAVHLAALLGGVTGWILGVVLRAGPMFVPSWRVAPRLALAAPWTLALGVLLAGLGEVARATALARLGEALALGTVTAVAVAGGAARRRRSGLLLVAQAGPESRLFRLALVAAGTAAAGSLLAAGLAWRGVPLSLLADALRHLVTVGFLLALVLAMAFRLIPAFDRRPLAWPRLREVAFWALLGSVLIRSAEVLADYGWEPVLAWLPPAGVLAWIAIGCVALNLAGAPRSRRGEKSPPAPAA
jgi:hypothetical protein